MVVAGESQADEEGKEGKKDEEAVALVKKEEPVCVGPEDELDGIVAMEDDEQEKPVKPTAAALTPEDKAQLDMLLKLKQQELLR